MSTREIIDILKENTTKWHTIKDLTPKLNINKSSIYKSLKQLKKSNDILYRMDLSEKNLANNSRILWEYKFKNDN